MKETVMNIVLLGPPGSGKGTQAEIISDELNLPHISTGDILRKAVSEETRLGKEALKYMNKGELVPDKLVVDIVNERLTKPDAKEGFILDGFPRTLKQAESLGKSLGENKALLNAVINISVGEKELINRLTARRTCKDCNKVYNTVYGPPEKEDYCDECGGKLQQREDDKIDTVRNRLDVYSKQTEPLINYYKEKSLLRSVDGGQEAKSVFSDIITVLKGEYA